jgi:hypothetical protein
VNQSKVFGSIPLEDLNENTPSVFTVAKRFFQKYKKECNLWPLDGDDFDTLVRLCLSSDNVLIEGTGYEQKNQIWLNNEWAIIWHPRWLSYT